MQDIERRAHLDLGRPYMHYLASHILFLHEDSYLGSKTLDLVQAAYHLLLAKELLYYSLLCMLCT
jgi:hypothetical protein